jgi:hypothetical protein
LQIRLEFFLERFAPAHYQLALTVAFCAPAAPKPPINQVLAAQIEKWPHGLIFVRTDGKLARTERQIARTNRKTRARTAKSPARSQKRPHEEANVPHGLTNRRWEAKNGRTDGITGLFVPLIGIASRRKGVASGQMAVAIWFSASQVVGSPSQPVGKASQVGKSPEGRRRSNSAVADRIIRVATQLNQILQLFAPLAGLQIRLELFLERFASAMDERFRSGQRAVQNLGDLFVA